MAFYFFLAFIIIPAVEIGLFMQAGDFIGFWPTLGLIFLTAIMGSTLLRWQGLSTLEKARHNINQNILPVDELFTGVCLLLAGILLLLPGFFTDAIGLLLFLPFFQKFLKHMVAGRIEGHKRHPSPHHKTAPSDFPPQQTIIDGDFEDITEKNHRSE